MTKTWLSDENFPRQIYFPDEKLLHIEVLLTKVTKSPLKRLIAFQYTKFSFEYSNSKVKITKPGINFCKLAPKEVEFNVEQHNKNSSGGLLGDFFIAERPTMGFSLAEMLGRYSIKYWEQNTRFFSPYFFIFKQS